MAGPVPASSPQHTPTGTPMQKHTSPRRAPMSADAYAGFLKLWLTPAHKAPAITPEVEAYLHHANQQAPLNDESRRVLDQTLRKAA